jgi:regulatory protein
MTDQQKRILDRLRGLCSRREYCYADVLKKAKDALDGDAQAAKEVADLLVEDKYVDDLRYASAYARDKASIQGWGDVKIRYMLSAKGVAASVITEALQEIDREKSSSRLHKLLENKLRSLKDDPQCRLKLLRFALGRGYSYDEASHTIDQLLR